jgi:hypothetical protein
MGRWAWSVYCQRVANGEGGGVQDRRAGMVRVLSHAPGFLEAVQWRGPRHGITALGLSVFFGLDEIVPILLQACKCAHALPPPVILPFFYQGRL